MAKNKKSRQKFKKLKSVSRNSKKGSYSQSARITEPSHPWRVCPYGEHWVKTHPMKIPPSETHPEGSVTTRHEHCARNPSGKDQLYPDEIQEIAKLNFANLKKMPCSVNLGYPEKGNKYDKLIAGWVQYWNDVLKPNEPLDPNLVKALIASESRFEPTLMADKSNSNSARGLTQITNKTRKILDGFHGDLKDHLISVTKAEMSDPNINICSGIRWLFEKRRLASSHMKSTASWIDSIWEYKGIRLAKTDEDVKRIKNIFNRFYKDLQKC